MPKQNIVKIKSDVKTNFIQTEFPIHTYLNKTKLKIKNKESESELFLKELLNNENSIYSGSKISVYKKFLLGLNSSIISLKESIDNMIKAEDVENEITSIYPQLSGYITAIQIKYTTDKNGNRKPNHKIYIEFNGKSDDFSYSHLKNKKSIEKYKNATIKEFLKLEDKFFDRKLEELEKEIPGLKGNIKLDGIKNKKGYYQDYYVYIYEDISNLNKTPIKRNMSTLLKNKEKYKDLSFKEIYSSLKIDNNKDYRKKTDIQYLDEYILSLVSDSERERIESIKINKDENNNKEFEIKLKDKKEILKAKLFTLRERKSEGKTYNSIEDLIKLKTSNKKLTEEQIKEILGNKAKYFHDFERSYITGKKSNYYEYFIILNINGDISKCRWGTVKKHLGLTDKDFEEKVKNEFTQRPKTDEDIELDLKNKIPDTIEEYNKFKEWDKKLDITTIKLIEKGETNQKNLFVIETNSGEEKKFEKSQVNYKQKTIKFKNGSESSLENKNYESNGETRFRNILFQNESIKECYDIHKEYEVLINNEKHRFDWVLINKETNKIDFIFEIDGVQHFNPKSTFKNKPIEKRVRKDKIKNEFAATHGIKLFRIRYEEFNKKLSELIFDVLTTKVLFEACSSMEMSNNAKINRYIERSKSESETKFQHKLEDIYFEFNENELLENLSQNLQNKEEFIKTLKDEIDEMLIYHNNSDSIPKDEFEIYEILNYLHYNQNIKLNYYE